jgi:tetratricopeptide (TPR) repeat protein
VLVLGPAGSSKTRLLHELLGAIEASGDDVEILALRGDPLSAGSPFGMLAPALRRRAGVVAGDAPERAREKLRRLVPAELGPDAARVTRFLGEMLAIPSHDAQSPEIAAARADALVMGDQVRAAWQAWLAAICARRPLLVVLEDLHHGDLPTIHAVDAALRSLADARFMVLALARPEAHERFPRLFAERRVVEVRLAGLGRRACERLVRASLHDAPAADVAALVDRAEGNPLFLEELVRARAAGHAALPETVLGLVQTRFDALPTEARRVLRAASVFGHVTWRGGVAALVGDDGAASVDEWLEELVRHELLDRRPTTAFLDEQEFSLRNATVREAAYAMLTPADRALGHHLAGAWLEAKGELDALVVAEHFERGGALERAVGWYRRAAEQALDGNDFDAVVARAEQAIRAGASGAALGQLHLLEAEALGWRGAFEPAAHHAHLATTLLAAGTAPYNRALEELAYASAALGRHDAVVAGARALLASPPGDVDARRAWIAALCRTANQLALAGRHALACELLAEVDRLAPALPLDQLVAARVYQARSFVAVGSDRLDDALEDQRAAAACFEQAGARRHSLASITYVAFLYLELGQHARAEHLLREVLASSERAGLAQGARTARNTLGLALALQGKTSDPLSARGHGAPTRVVVEDRRVDGGARGYLAAILYLAGDLEGAEREATSAAEALRPYPAMYARALGVLGDVYTATGRVALALEVTGEGMALVERFGALLLGESRLRLARARALAASGDEAAARDAIRTAREGLLGRAARLAEADRRRSFLEDVPENTETLRLAAEWLDHRGA